MVTKNKHTYSTALILQFKLGLAPQHLIDQIPSSTKSNWRRRSMEHIIGLEQEISAQEIAVIKYALTCDRLRTLCRALYQLCQTYQLLLFSLSNSTALLKRFWKEIQEITESLSGVVGQKHALKAFRLSPSQWAYWKGLRHCQESITNACLKRSPLQLLSEEVEVIKTYLQKEEYQNWSLTAVYYQMMRDGAAYCSQNTFYKYAKALGVIRLKYLTRNKKHKQGVRAKKPKDLLHLDVTIFRPRDQSKVYLYVLMDNCSRFILSITASLEYRANHCLDNLKKGLSQYCLPEENGLTLMTDGGPENQGDFKTYLDRQTDLTHWVSLQDIDFSNSMVEAVNKHLKYQYLFTKAYNDFEAVNSDLDKLVSSYNAKPHGALYGLTPHEVFVEGKTPNSLLFQKQKLEARKKRLGAHREKECSCPLDSLG